MADHADIMTRILYALEALILIPIALIDLLTRSTPTAEPTVVMAYAVAAPAAPAAPGLGCTGQTVAQLRRQARSTLGASRLPSGRLIRDARKAELLAALAY